MEIIHLPNEQQITDINLQLILKIKILNYALKTKKLRFQMVIKWDLQSSELLNKMKDSSPLIHALDLIFVYLFHKKAPFEDYPLMAISKNDSVEFNLSKDTIKMKCDVKRFFP